MKLRHRSVPGPADGSPGRPWGTVSAKLPGLPVLRGTAWDFLFGHQDGLACVGAEHGGKGPVQRIGRVVRPGIRELGAWSPQGPGG